MSLSFPQRLRAVFQCCDEQSLATAIQCEHLEKEAPEDAVRRLSVILGDRPKVCILGATEFYNAHSESIVQGLAAELCRALGSRCTFITGGLHGVQGAFADCCADGAALFHVLPFGQRSHFRLGKDIFAGSDVHERSQVTGLLGDVYVTIEGGPGVSAEAQAAVARGALVVPMRRTGGASAGMFNFPATALARPECATEEQWALLADESAPPADSADAAVKIINAYVSKLAG